MQPIARTAPSSSAVAATAPLRARSSRGVPTSPATSPATHVRSQTISARCLLVVFGLQLALHASIPSARCTLYHAGETDSSGSRKCWGRVGCPTGTCPEEYVQGSFCYSNGDSKQYKVCGCNSSTLAIINPIATLLVPPSPPSPEPPAPPPAPPPPPLRGCSGNPEHCSSCGSGTCLKDFCPSGDVKVRMQHPVHCDEGAVSQ